MVSVGAINNRSSRRVETAGTGRGFAAPAYVPARDGYSPAASRYRAAASREAFSVADAAKEFGKGLAAPFVKAYRAFRKDWVIASLFMVGGAVAVGAVVTPLVLALPAWSPLIAGALAAPGLWQLGKGVIAAVRNYRNGDYDASEQAFGLIGEGTMKAALAAIPVLKLGRFARTPGGKAFGARYLDSLAEASKHAPRMYVSPAGGGVSLTPISIKPDGGISVNLPIN